MCENSVKPENDGEETETSIDNINTEMEIDDNDFGDISPEDFDVLDKQLDALNSALDNIEEKNDNIHAQLVVLLESNREIRKQMQNSN